MPTVVDRYLLRQFVQVLIICLMSIIGLYIVIDAFGHLDHFVDYAGEHGGLLKIMGIYYAYLDRAPVFIMGATGPLAEPKRRPFIDWIHTANVQGEAIRNFVKWDYQPSTVDGVPGAFARAYSIMMSARQGPIYMCYDAGLQEAPLTADVPYDAP